MNQPKLDDENNYIANLETFYDKVKNHWSNIKLHHNRARESDLTMMVDENQEACELF